MNIYVLRHASAGERRANPLLDPKRPLDKEGKQHCLRLAHVLNAMKLQFDLIVSSPLKRCMQTASFVGTEMGYEAPILTSTALAPDATFPQFQKLLLECHNGDPARENVLVVGHNPNLSSFLSAMLVKQPGPGFIRLRKGSLARVSLVRGPGMLMWLLDPRIVRSLYATSTVKSLRKTSRK